MAKRKVKNYEDFKEALDLKKALFYARTIPYALVHHVLSRLNKAEAMMSLKYRDMKNKTMGKGMGISSGELGTIDDELTRVSIKDLPESSRKRGLYPLFNSWKIYYAGERKDSSVIRRDGTPHTIPLFYISKDDLQRGDTVIGYRGHEPREKDKHTSTTMMILCAKVDIDPEIPETFNNIKDIYTSEIIDNFNLEFKESKNSSLIPPGKSQGFFIDKAYKALYIELVPKDRDRHEISEKLIEVLESCKKQSIQMLNASSKEWKWESDMTFSVPIGVQKMTFQRSDTDKESEKITIGDNFVKLAIRFFRIGDQL